MRPWLSHSLASYVACEAAFPPELALGLVLGDFPNSYAPTVLIDQLSITWERRDTGLIRPTSARQKMLSSADMTPAGHTQLKLTEIRSTNSSPIFASLLFR